MNDAAGRQVWAVLELLDRQIVDRDGELAGKVDDLELEVPCDDPDGLPHVIAILSGLGALAGHIGGDAGRWLASVEHRLTAQRDRLPSRLPFTLVRAIESSIDVAAERAELDSNRAEQWARDVIIARIPGADHAPE
ncbi:MAG: hypothetical protein ABWY77_05605 [Acidimicrobiia bacterium]